MVRVVFEPASAVKPLTSFLTSFLRYKKTLQTCLHALGMPCPPHQKIITWKALSYLSPCKISNS